MGALGQNMTDLRPAALLVAVLLTVPGDRGNAQESDADVALFSDLSCDQVGQRAGAIMMGRMGGLSKREATESVRKTELDASLIDEAYALPSTRDNLAAFDQIEEFTASWVLRCQAMR